MSFLENTLAENPLIAILRGLPPEDAISVADILFESGFRIIEVPLNSPEPLVSIRLIAKKYGSRATIGAGTVLTEEDVASVVEAGGQIIVAPNLDTKVGTACRDLGVSWCPGVLSPTEAFKALHMGAAILKFFPAELATPNAIAAMRSVLPQDCIIAAVGGITPETMFDYHIAGVNSFGLGSALYKPDYELSKIKEKAKNFINAYRSLIAQ